MPIIKNTGDKPLEIETDGKKITIKTGEETVIQNPGNLKILSGKYDLR